MAWQRANRVYAVIVVILSLTALGTVLIGTGGPPQPDEGTAAHIFQLSIAGLVPSIALFMLTADRRRPMLSVATLAASAVALIVAFTLLYHFEHRG